MRVVSEDRAREILGCNFIGSKELNRITKLQFENNNVPEIVFSEDELEEKKDNYLLILGVDRFSDSRLVTIRNLKSIFGENPEECEPCFYNQDWYDKEGFIDEPMKREWFFIRKSIYEESRMIQPEVLLLKYAFPSAIKCTYAFFVSWYSSGIKLWYHDYVWCSDTDHNGDRVYVGKYHDIDGINKNGFSIHRHLALRECYGCID